jgi:hypothetical protein
LAPRWVLPSRRTAPPTRTAARSAEKCIRDSRIFVRRCR